MSIVVQFVGLAMDTDVVPGREMPRLAETDSEGPN